MLEADEESRRGNSWNDLPVGDYIFRSPDAQGLIQAIAPTFEVHSNTPMNHRDVVNSRDPAGSTRVVDLTAGLNIFFRDKAMLSFGLAEPITGPRPFGIEALALFNVSF